jgi:hypothetical protein
MYVNCSLNIIKMVKSRRMKWAKHEARLEKIRNSYKILVVKPEGKRPAGRHRHVSDNIKNTIILQRIKKNLKQEGVRIWNWIRIRIQWPALVSTVMHNRVLEIVVS